MNEELLFSNQYFSDAARQRQMNLVDEIQNYDMDAIISIPTEKLLEYFEDKYLMNAPHLKLEEKYFSEKPRESVISEEVMSEWGRLYKTNRNYINFIVCIPFDGDGSLLYLMPSSRQNMIHNERRRISISGEEIQLSYQELIKDNQPDLDAIYERDIQAIAHNIQCLNNDVQSFNQQLPVLIRQKIEERKQTTGKTQSIIKALKLPIKKRGDVPATYNIPEIRKKPSIIEKPSTKTFVPEPTLATEEYENILNIIKDMALAMERSPKTFIQLDEPDIRNIFLISLNGHYEGNATGETFNGIGKTDVLVRHNNVNAFIAECKFWKGAKVMVETVDQLLGYVTWRDTKTAILLFNTQPNLSAVIVKAREALKTHQNYKSEYQLQMPSLKNNQTIFGYKFKHPSDQEKEVYLTLMAFQINNPVKV